MKNKIMETKNEVTREEIDKYISEDLTDIVFEKFTDFLEGVDEYEYDEIVLMKEELDNWMKKIEILKLNPKKCPKCGSAEVLKIEYGEHSVELNERIDIYWGGCCITGEDPEWHCKKCRWEWGKKFAGHYCEDDVDEDDTADKEDQKVECEVTFIPTHKDKN
ncbi:MAG: hypothetical protein NTW11_00850 [Candidatus Staskawiczbacteria bacterium]|nr:hypothetical protein [Candidatus Staskawiczbacteria bacterium]